MKKSLINFDLHAWEDVKSNHTNPSIKYDPSKGILEIKGTSTMPNSRVFWIHIQNYICLWLSKKELFEMDIYIEKLNLSSEKALREIFDIFGRSKISSIPVINWHYYLQENESKIYDYGDAFRRSFRGKFNLIKTPQDLFV